MTTTEENLKAFIQSDAIKAVVGTRVSYNHVPGNFKTPYIFFQQAGSADDISLGDSPGTPTRPRYAWECWADNPAEAIALKNLVQARLHKYRGAVGTLTVQGIFAEDVDDEYIPNGNGGDDGLHGAALFSEVVL